MAYTGEAGSPPQRRGLIKAFALGSAAIVVAVMLFGHPAKKADDATDDSASEVETQIKGADGNEADASDSKIAKAKSLKAASQDQLDRQTMWHAKKGAAIGHAVVRTANTIELDGKTFVLADILVPGNSMTCTGVGGPVLCGSQTANQLVTLTKDHLVACYDKAPDAYGRMLGACYVGQMQLASTLVERGFALSDKDPVTQRLVFAVQQSTAKLGKRGLWATGPVDASLLISSN